MEKLISIDLSSPSYGFFKNPQYNGEKNNKSYSYDSIHKLAIYGLLGRTIGLRGIGNSPNLFPEYYEKLKGIKVGIEVLNTIRKGWDRTVSSSGLYSNGPDGGVNLIIEKNVIISPEYRLYLKLDLTNKIHEEIYNVFKDNLLFYFGTIYFGNTSYTAHRENFKEYSFSEAEKFEGKVKTLFKSDFKAPTSRRGNNSNTVKEIGFVFETNKEVIYERNVSIPVDYVQIGKNNISGYC